MKGKRLSRKVDSFGRIVLPSEVRSSLGIKKNSIIDLEISKGAITISKHKECCVFCNSSKLITDFRGYDVCMKCVSIMNEMDIDTN